MVVNYGACQTRCKAYAQRGEKVFVKSGNCHIEHTAIFCLCYAVVFLVFDHQIHLTLYKDVFPMIQMLLNLFLTIALSIFIAVLVLVRM